jgi:thioesterase domain-containing protein
VDVVVGGWSYGGVVASILANLATSSGKIANEPVNITSLILFDPPLRKRQRVSEEAVEDTERILPAPAKNSAESDASADDEAERNAHNHFEACTELLRRYHSSIPDKLDGWAVTDARLLYMYPERSDYTSGEGSAAEMTRGEVTCAMSPGNHWTMLFGNNAFEAAKLTTSFLDQN